MLSINNFPFPIRYLEIELQIRSYNASRRARSQRAPASASARRSCPRYFSAHTQREHTCEPPHECERPHLQNTGACVSVCVPDCTRRRRRRRRRVVGTYIRFPRSVRGGTHALAVCSMHEWYVHTRFAGRSHAARNNECAVCV